MSIIASLRARQAMVKQQKGEYEEAAKLYEEAIEKGLNAASPMLAYSVLLLRSGEYEKAKKLMVKVQKIPGLQDAQKSQMYMNYAVAAYKLGDLPRAIELLEKQHARGESGLIYQTLGYLYIETGDTDKALAYNKAALEYDDEDPVVLDNLGQVYYRMVGDKETAKKYFDKAHEIKDGQIDTLYFLAQYDLEAGRKEEALEKLERTLDGRFSPLNYASKEKIQAQIESLQGPSADSTME